MTDSTNPLTILLSAGPPSFLIDLLRYLIAASLMAIVVAILMRTRFKGRKIQARKATRRDMTREILQSVRSCGVYLSVTVAFILGINLGYLKPVGDSLGWQTDLFLIVVMIVMHDSYFYWVHRALHHPLLYRRFHLAHHRSVTPTAFAAYSFSVGEAFLMALFVIFWQFTLPTPGIVLFVFLTFQIARNVMGHAGFELMPRWWLSTPFTRWINTTTHHDLHHAGGFNYNFGLYFTFWDKWMGTEHPQYRQKFMEITGREELVDLDAERVPEAGVSVP